MNGINYSVPLNHATQFSQNGLLTNLHPLLKEITVIALAIFAIGAVCLAIGYLFTCRRIEPETVTHIPSNTLNGTDERVNIVVRTIERRDLNIQISLNSTVRELKHRFTEAIGIDHDTLRWLYQGKTLEDHRTLNDYQIPANGIVHQVLKYRW